MSAKASAAPEYFNHSGNECRSFKEGPDFDTLYFGPGGIYNLDASSTLQVACPISWSGFTMDSANTAARVTVIYRDGTQTGAISCSWVMDNVLGIPLYGPSRYSCGSDQTSGCTGTIADTHFQSGNALTTLTLTPPPMTQQIANMNLYCMMPPGTSIVGYYLYTPTHNGQ